MVFKSTQSYQDNLSNIDDSYFEHVLSGNRVNSVDIKSKKEGKDQKPIQSSTTTDPGYQGESDNVTNRHHKGEPRGQPFPSSWPQAIDKQTCMKA